MAAVLHWHQTATPDELYLSAEPKCRPFAVPTSICRGTASLRLQNAKLLVTHADGFDQQWYLSRYPDVAAANVDALEHYLLHGEQEGRDPTPLFASSGYAYQVGLAGDESALLAAIENNRAICSPLLIERDQTPLDAPHILLFAHAVKGGQFGAERSFIDVLQALQGRGFRLTVALPGAGNAGYVDTVRQYCHSLLILPYTWWAGRRPCQPLQLKYLTDFISTEQVKLVYVNTLVLYEPLLAARSAGVPGVVHVRELPAHDINLCQSLNATAEQIRKHVLDTADYLIANSTVVASWLAEPERCTVIANAMQMRPVADIVAGDCLKVGMLSSNLVKKGLADFMLLAQNCAAQKLPFTFYLFGPESADLKAYSEHNQVPENVQLCGYEPLPEKALAQVDVVLNLSHFQESFGRTVLEAMQAGRVVVAYDWGALPELIQSGCGFMVPFKDTSAVEQILWRLHLDRALLHNTAQQAKKFATEQYSLARLGHNLQTLFSRILAKTTTM
jgi:glycosyltransferase involved in cell wall biosynthesis